MDDLSPFCCPNKDCPDYGLRGLENLTVCARYGKKKPLRLLYCRSCKARFSQRKGTALFQAHLDEDKIVSVLQHIQEECGVRSTTRLTGGGVTKETVVRYNKLEGRHSKDLHDEWVAFSPLRPGKASSMRNGLSSARKRSTVIRSIRRMRIRATTGITSPMIRNIAW